MIAGRARDDAHLAIPPSRLAPQKRRTLLLVSLAALTTALGGLVWLGFREPHGPKQTLPDGTTLELLGVTYGKHQLVYGSFWARTFGLLQEWAAKLPFHRDDPRIWMGSRDSHEIVLSDDGHAVTYSAPQVPVVWFRIHSSKSAPATSRLSDYSFVLRDSDGCVYPHDGSTSLGITEASIPAQTATDSLGCSELTVFPRRQSVFQLEVHSRTAHPTVVARFEINNPAPPATLVWTADATPLTRRLDGLRVTLSTVRLQPSPELGLQAVTQYHIVEPSRPTRKWTVEYVAEEDATGNQWNGGFYRLTANGLRFPCPCPKESAWKLNLDLAPADGEAPDAATVLPGICFPPSDHWKPFRRLVELPQVDLLILGLHGKGNWHSPAQSFPGSMNPGFEVSIRAKTWMRLHAAAVGVKHPSDDYTSEGTLEVGPGETEGLLNIRGAKPGKPLNIRLEASRLRHVQMLVRPK